MDCESLQRGAYCMLTPRGEPQGFPVSYEVSVFTCTAQREQSHNRTERPHRHTLAVKMSRHANSIGAAWAAPPVLSSLYLRSILKADGDFSSSMFLTFFFLKHISYAAHTGVSVNSLPKWIQYTNKADPHSPPHHPDLSKCWRGPLSACTPPWSKLWCSVCFITGSIQIHLWNFG